MTVRGKEISKCYWNSNRKLAVTTLFSEMIELHVRNKMAMYYVF